MSDRTNKVPTSTESIDVRQRRAGAADDGARERLTMTITELARALGISRTTCYELAQRRELPVRVVRVGRRLLVPKVEVTRFLEGARPNEARDGAPR